MNRPVLTVVLLALSACQPAKTSTPPDAEKPEATPVAGQGRIGGQGQRTSGGDPDYDEEWGKSKTAINITVDNRCSSTARLYFGHRIPPGPVDFLSLNGRSQQNIMMLPGDRTWLVDEDGNGFANTVIGMNSTSIIVDSSCEDIYAE